MSDTPTAAVRDEDFAPTLVGDVDIEEISLREERAGFCICSYNED